MVMTSLDNEQIKPGPCPVGKFPERLEQINRVVASFLAPQYVVSVKMGPRALLKLLIVNIKSYQIGPWHTTAAA